MKTMCDYNELSKEELIECCGGSTISNGFWNLMSYLFHAPAALHMAQGDVAPWASQAYK